MRRKLRCALSAVTASVAVLGCSRAKKTTLFLPADGTQIDITLEYPFDAATRSREAFADVCGGARSFLVSLDETTSLGITPSYRFLLSTNGELYGCTSGKCVNPSIHVTLPRPHKVVVEGLDLPPDEYLTAPASNVLCRGIADDTLSTGSIDAVALPTPSPSSSPVDIIGEKVSVRTPMLRIGALNGMFSQNGPEATIPLAARLGGRTDRTVNGGRIAIGGGEFPYTTNIYLFDPRTISFSPPSATLAGPRYYGPAVGFDDSSGNASILFAGGQDNDLFPRTVEYWDGASPVTSVLPMFNGRSRKDLGLVLIPDHHEQGGHFPAVALLGGYDYDAVAESATYDFFYPTAPPDISACVTGSLSGKAGVCRPGAGNAMGDGREALVAGLIQTDVGVRIFIGGGQNNQSSLPANGYFFDPENFAYTAASGTGVTATDTRVVTLTTSLLAYFGGSDSGGGPAAQWTLVRGRNRSIAVGAGTMRAARLATKPTRLLTADILIAGYGVTLEEFHPAAVTMTTGTFEFVSRFPTGACSSGGEADCVRLVESPETSTQILGSLMWLNGAVVFTFGTHLPQIFVPAYECAGTTAVRPFDGATIAEVDYCDRLRTPLAITDPDSPTRLP